MPPIALYAIALSGQIFGLVLLQIWRRRSACRTRKNPLTRRNLLRRPGQTLQEAVDDKGLEILSDLAVLGVLPPLGALSLAISPSPTVELIVGVLLLASFAWLGFRVVRGLRGRRLLRLGLEGEMATGEELNQLMLRGCRVFHDIPGEGFNVDHVVVGPGGVFAVETKARAKPLNDLGKHEYRVIYDGNSLQFPSWQTRQPIEQAERQAAWLGRWLSSAVGAPVAVHPAVALPGWLVERKAPGGVFVFNPKNPVFLADPRNGSCVSDTLIQRVAHQLEQRCRDVAPQAYTQGCP